MTSREQDHQRDLERLKRLRLMDDDFLSICMKDNIRGAQLMLRIILDMKDLHIKSLSTQKEFKSLSGHSFCFDVYAEDGQGNPLEIEVQRNSVGARPERAACHSGVLDANSMEKGDEDFSHKAETYVIFITEHDILKGNKPLYHIERCILEMNNSLFGDKSHIVYVNGAYKGDKETALSKLVHDMFCADPDKMHYEELAERARYFKRDSEGVKVMCEIWEEIRREGEARGETKGKLEAARNMAAGMLALGKLTIEEIAAISHLSPEEVRSLA